MNCLKCHNQAGYYCSCSEIYLCKYHLGDHLLSKGSHRYQDLVSIKSSEEKSKFQEKLKSQISSLKTLKTFILSQSISLQSSINSLVAGLTNQIKSFSDLLILERSFLPETEERQSLLDSVLESELVIHTKHFDSIMENLEKLLKIDLFHIKMKNLNSSQGMFSDKFLKTHNSGFLCLGLANDGNTLLTGSQDTSLRFWDLGQKKQTACLLKHKGQVKCLAISSDSALAATGSYDRTVILWDVRKKAFKHSFVGHAKAVFSVAFTFDCEFVISGSLAFEILIWKTRSLDCLGKIKTRESVRCGITNYSNLFIAGIGKFLEVWDLSSFTNLTSIQAHDRDILCITTTFNGKYTITGSSDCRIRIWELQYQSNYCTFTGHRDEVISLAVNLDDNLLASGSIDETIIIWNIKLKSKVTSLRPHNDHINSLVFSTNMLISVSRDSKIILTNLLYEKVEFSLTTEPFYLNSYHVRHHLISFGSSKDVIIWNLAQNEEQLLKGHLEEVQATCISSKLKYLISSSRGNEKNLILWDLEQQSMAANLAGHLGSVFCVDISDDELHIISGDCTSSVKLWFLRNYQQVYEFKGHWGPVYSVKFTSNKKLAASAGLDKKLIVWDVFNKVMHACFDKGLTPIWKVFITTDDKFVISADRFNGVSVYNLDAKRLESIYESKAQAKDLLEKYSDMQGELGFYLF